MMYIERTVGSFDVSNNKDNRSQKSLVCVQRWNAELLLYMFSTSKTSLVSVCDHITNIIENDPRHSLLFHDGVNNVPAVCLLVGLLEFAMNNDDAIVAFRSEQCLLVL